MDEMQLETILVISCVWFLLKILQEIIAKSMESSINLDMVGEETINNSYFVIVVLHNYPIPLWRINLSKDLGH
jgi:hypothetical protein